MPKLGSRTIHHSEVPSSTLTGLENTTHERGEYNARPSVIEDIGAIAASMRPADQREVRLLSGQGPLDALTQSFVHSSVTRTLSYKDQPLIMYGTAEFQPGVGIVWGLGSEALDDHVVGFLRMSRPEVDILQGSYRTLFNYVHADNELHLKWVKFVGFTLFDPMTHESGETVIPIQRSN